MIAQTIDLSAMSTRELWDLDDAIRAEHRARCARTSTAMCESIAAAMSARRQASGLTISQVAQRAKLRRATVRHAETAGSSSVTTLVKILDGAYGEKDPMNALVAIMIEARHAGDGVQGAVAA